MPARIIHYDQGDVWIPQASFTVSGTPTDPTTVTVRTKNPAGVVTVIGPVAGNTGGSGITRVSAGLYTIQVALDDAGYWSARFEGTGAAAAAEDQTCIVDPSEFYESAQIGTRALVGLAETKDWLQQQNIDTSNDLELVRVINDISERFHDEADREFKVVGTNPQVRLFDVDMTSAYQLVVSIGDLAAAPTLVRLISTDWTTVTSTVTSTDIISEPVNRPAWAPIRRLRLRRNAVRLATGMRVEVTGTWGFPAVPGSVRQAVLDAVASTVDRDVEDYRQDQRPSTSGESGNVVVFGNRPQMISLPPTTLAVARSFQDLLVA